MSWVEPYRTGEGLASRHHRSTERLPQPKLGLLFPARMPKAPSPRTLDKAGLERLSKFRWELRRFLRFSEEAARHEGITVLQYQLMLHTQGFCGRNWASIVELAERLQSHHHGVVALVGRCEDAGLVFRQQNETDRRLVEIHLQDKGRELLERLARQHYEELEKLVRALRQRSGTAGDCFF